jgi:hypothetical protein
VVVLLTQLAVPPHPGVGALDHPALRLHLEATLARQPLDDLQRAQPALGQKALECAAKGLIGPNLLELDPALGRGLKHPLGTVKYRPSLALPQLS